MTYAFFPRRGLCLVANIDRHPIHGYFRVHSACHGETHARLGEWVHIDDVRFLRDSEVAGALELNRSERSRVGVECPSDCWCNNG